MVAIPSSWTKTAKELGIPAAAMFVMFAIGIMFWQSWTKQIAAEGAAKEALLTKFVDATLENGKEQTAAVGEMKSLMQDLRGLNRKARECDAELLSVQKEIRDYVKMQATPAAKTGKSP